MQKKIIISLLLVSAIGIGIGSVKALSHKPVSRVTNPSKVLTETPVYSYETTQNIVTEPVNNSQVIVAPVNPVPGCPENCNIVGNHSHDVLEHNQNHTNHNQNHSTNHNNNHKR